jgi:hypothetical protein
VKQNKTHTHPTNEVGIHTNKQTNQNTNKQTNKQTHKMTQKATSQNKHHKSRKQTTLKSTCFAQFNTQANTCVHVKQCKQHASSNIPAHCKHRDCESSQHNKQHANKTASMRKRNEME